MRAITHALLPASWSPPGPVLELGCGAGVFATELASRWPATQVVGLDRTGLALAHAQEQSGTARWLQADLHALPFLRKHFSTVIALDVLDQRAVEIAVALAEIGRVLMTGGLLLLRVSAYRWLTGQHDIAFNTGRRFGKGELLEIVRAAGFSPLRTTFANTLMTAPIVALRLLQRWGLAPFSETVYGDSLANRLICRTLMREAAWLHSYDLPFGISLYLLALWPGAGTRRSNETQWT